MVLTGKKLGLLLSGDPKGPGFTHGLRLAQHAQAAGVRVYVYVIDAAVAGVDHTALQDLRAGGAELFACAYSAEKRGLSTGPTATWCGLTLLSDVIAGTDRFLHFG